MGTDVQPRSIFILLSTVVKWYISAYIQEEEKRELIQKDIKKISHFSPAIIDQKAPRR